MTHATITRHSAILCCVEFAYHAATKDAVKALSGATYEDGQWLVPTMHLPTLKGLFSTMDVTPNVVADYHELLRRMLCDTMTSAGRKGELGRHLAELHERHAVGIAHILATGWQPTPTARPQHAAQPVVVAEVPPAIDAPDLAIWLRGVQGAIKLDDRKQSILAKRRRQPAR